MRLLLDTHIWLWALLQPNRLTPAVRELIEDSVNELWLSSISSWEASLLMERGHVQVAEQPGEWIRRALRAFPLRDAPITRAVALLSRNLNLTHQDPADRFICSSAIAYDLTLVTADARLLEFPDIHMISNR